MNIVFSDTNVADGSEEDDPVFCEFPIGPGHQFSPADEVHNYAEELLKISGQKVIVSESKIMDLFKGRCQEPSCSSQCKVRSKSVGCTQRFGGLAKMDKGKWSLSEKYGAMYSNNLQFSAAVLLSGNNYSKVKMMSRFLALACPSKASFFRVQKFNCIPAIEEW